MPLTTLKLAIRSNEIEEVSTKTLEVFQTLKVLPDPSRKILSNANQALACRRLAVLRQQ